MGGWMKRAALGAAALTVVAAPAWAQTDVFNQGQWVWADATQAECLDIAATAMESANAQFGLSEGVRTEAFAVQNASGAADIVVYCIADDHEGNQVTSATAARVLVGIDVRTFEVREDAAALRDALDLCIFEDVCPGANGAPAQAAAGGKPRTAAPPPVAIAWTDTATRYEDRQGELLSFICPPRPIGASGAVYGSDLYTSDSPICLAAVHSGVITAQGGEVTIQVQGEQPAFESTTRNGITTTAYGAWGGSYIFIR